ncbi:MAG TPA: nucleotidyltransferase family protein [Chitinophagales bacterium]|nr:nucleotidyltransferase family protein [Chitinophagales bacterium]
METKVSNKENLLQLISAHKGDITGFGVKELALFGSFKRNEATEDSDVDLFVEFRPGEKNFSNFIRLAFFLQDLFGRKVELLTRQSLSPFIGPKIMKELEYVSLTG